MLLTGCYHAFDQREMHSTVGPLMNVSYRKHGIWFHCIK